MGVQAEHKNRRRAQRTNVREPRETVYFCLKRAEGEALSLTFAQGIEAAWPKQTRAGSVHESPARRVRKKEYTVQVLITWALITLNFTTSWASSTRRSTHFSE